PPGVMGYGNPPAAYASYRPTAPGAVPGCRASSPWGSGPSLAGRTPTLHGPPGGAVTAPDDQVQRYRIVARGESPVLLGGVADGLQIESGRGWTSVVASVRDES